jgi:hypothetical protein
MPTAAIMKAAASSTKVVLAESSGLVSSTPFEVETEGVDRDGWAFLLVASHWPVSIALERSAFRAQAALPAVAWADAQGAASDHDRGSALRLSDQCLAGGARRQMESPDHPRHDVRQPPALPRIAEQVGGRHPVKHPLRPSEDTAQRGVSSPARTTPPTSRASIR